jgi:hypothetical protein
VAYREEREALRARLEELERENAQLRGRLASLSTPKASAHPLLGGALELTHEGTLERELSGEELERVEAIAAERLGRGHRGLRGSRTRWTRVRGTPRRIDLFVSSRDGRTRIRFVERTHALAGALFGGLGGGVGGGGLAFAVVMGILVSPLAATGLGVAWLGLVYVMVRERFGAIVRRQDLELAALLAEIESSLAVPTSSASSRVRVEEPGDASPEPTDDEDDDLTTRRAPSVTVSEPRSRP